MTGQILSGVPPVEAVKYQILVMFLIAGGTGFGAVAAVLGGVYRLTDTRHRLRLDRLTVPQPLEPHGPGGWPFWEGTKRDSDLRARVEQ